MKNLTNKLKNEKGFTIIEVVLVLAIAGLIFMVVFMALPQLQASRRDNQRKRSAERVIAAITTWQGNTSTNDIPKTTDLNATWISEYMQGDFEDPEHGDYVFVGTDPVLGSPSGKQGIQYVTNKSCDGGKATGTAGVKGYAVVVALEQGTACYDSQ